MKLILIKLKEKKKKECTQFFPDVEHLFFFLSPIISDFFFFFLSTCLSKLPHLKYLMLPPTNVKKSQQIENQYLEIPKLHVLIRRASQEDTNSH